MLDGPGDLIESHHLPSRPATPLFVLGWAILFWFLLWREDMDVHPWIALGYGVLGAWSQVESIDVDRYGGRAGVFLQTISITMAKGSSLVLNLREGRRLVEQIAEHVLPKK